MVDIIINNKRIEVDKGLAERFELLRENLLKKEYDVGQYKKLLKKYSDLFLIVKDYLTSVENIDLLSTKDVTHFLIDNYINEVRKDVYDVINDYINVTKNLLKKVSTALTVDYRTLIDRSKITMNVYEDIFNSKKYLEIRIDTYDEKYFTYDDLEIKDIVKILERLLEYDGAIAFKLEDKSIYFDVNYELFKYIDLYRVLRKENEYTVKIVKKDPDSAFVCNEHVVSTDKLSLVEFFREYKKCYNLDELLLKIHRASLLIRSNE